MRTTARSPGAPSQDFFLRNPSSQARRQGEGARPQRAALLLKPPIRQPRPKPAGTQLLASIPCPLPWLIWLRSSRFAQTRRVRRHPGRTQEVAFVEIVAGLARVPLKFGCVEREG